MRLQHKSSWPSGRSVISVKDRADNYFIQASCITLTDRADTFVQASYII